MAESIEIPVTYKNKELSFKAHVLRYGFVQHILVDVEGTQITIERDEENNYRALKDAKIEDGMVNPDLVKALVNVLEAL